MIIEVFYPRSETFAVAVLHLLRVHVSMAVPCGTLGVVVPSIDTININTTVR